MIKIRDFKPKDATAVCNLIRRNDLEISSNYYPQEVINYWNKDLTPEKILEKSRQRTCLVAQKETQNKIEVIGYVSFLNGEIKKLFVLPEFHRRGVGKHLIEILEERTEEVWRVYSTIYAEPFYKSCGFEKIENSWQETDNHIKYKLIYMKRELK